MMNTTYFIIDIFILIFACIGFLTSTGIVFLIIYQHHRSSISASILLICNTYISIIFICIIIFDMYAHNLYGDLYQNISFDNQWCYIRAYLLHVGLATIYHSYLLQALFRFFRVVFFKSRRLQTIQFISTLILIQWLLDFILILPSLLLHHFERISEYYYCQLSYLNLSRLLFPAFVVFYIPMIGISLIYFSILFHMKKTKNQSVIENRRRMNQRDLIVLRRIIILVGILLMLSFPSVILWLNYFATSYLNPLIYHLQWLTYTFSLSILPTVSAYLTPHLHKLLCTVCR